MNTVTLNFPPQADVAIEPGAWFKDKGGRLYILALVDHDSYACISILDGNRYDTPSDSISGAIEKLILVAHSARVEVTP